MGPEVFFFFLFEREKKLGTMHNVNPFIDSSKRVPLHYTITRKKHEGHFHYPTLFVSSHNVDYFSGKNNVFSIVFYGMQLLAS